MSLHYVVKLNQVKCGNAEEKGAANRNAGHAHLNKNDVKILGEYVVCRSQTRELTVVMPKNPEAPAASRKKQLHRSVCCGHVRLSGNRCPSAYPMLGKRN